MLRVYDESRENDVFLRLKKMGDSVTLEVVDERGKHVVHLLTVSEYGVTICRGAAWSQAVKAGLKFDDAGRLRVCGYSPED